MEKKKQTVAETVCVYEIDKESERKCSATPLVQ